MRIIRVAIGSVDADEHAVRSHQWTTTKEYKRVQSVILRLLIQEESKLQSPFDTLFSLVDPGNNPRRCLLAVLSPSFAILLAAERIVSTLSMDEQPNYED